MKAESQSRLGAVLEEPCLVQAAVTELMKQHAVEAIAIKACLLYTSDAADE